MDEVNPWFLPARETVTTLAVAEALQAAVRNNRTERN